jgi:hypothetical protein
MQRTKAKERSSCERGGGVAGRRGAVGCGSNRNVIYIPHLPYTTASAATGLARRYGTPPPGLSSYIAHIAIYVVKSKKKAHRTPNLKAEKSASPSSIHLQCYLGVYLPL